MLVGDVFYIGPGQSLGSEYHLTGTWNDPACTSFNATLSGSQSGVIYSLIKEREYPNTIIINSTIAEITGTGNAITFSNVTQKGIYKVVVKNPDNTWAEVSGVINMFNQADMPVVVDNSNYTKTRKYFNGAGSQYAESAVHYDGLGRPIQEVAVGAGSNGEDIIQVIEYDNMGRNDAKVSMPYSRPGVGYQMSAISTAEQRDYYATKFPDGSDKNYAYSRKVYDGTTVTAYGPGSSGNDYPVQQESYLNNGLEGIQKYVMADDGISLRNAGPYPAGKLSVQKVKQLNLPANQQSEKYTYTNSAGQVVAEETRASTQDRRITYYVYDDMGRQRYVIPPIKSDSLPNLETSLSELRKYCFYNEYDDHGRIVKQYVPGAEPTYTLYDRRGRVAMTQDGRQRDNGANRWAFTKYDALDRPVMTGVVSGGTYDTHKSALDNQTVFGETRGGALHGYTNNTYPSAGTNDVLTVAYYDNYDWLNGNTGYGFSTSSDISVGARNTTGITGLQTGTKAKVLGITGHQWLTSVTYYDSKYQAILSIADLYPSGKETVWNRHNFTGTSSRQKSNKSPAARLMDI